MRFTLLAHAAFWLEHRDTSVLVDPWLFDTCYDSAWALLPEPRDLIAQLPRPQWILYSHGHPDHFHPATLAALAARFGRDVPIVVPHLLSGRLTAALRAMGFPVREAAAGRDVALGDDLAVRFYPVRADDSLQVFRTARHTLVNANDCQLEGRLLHRLAQLHHRPDFYFGQFSIADGYPFRLDGISADDARAAAAVPAERFRRQAEAFAARHAVPTASGFRFARADNRDMNRWNTTIDDVRAMLATLDTLTILYPGDGWSDDGGFVRDPAHRDAHARAVAAMRDGSAPCAPREPTPERSAIEAAAAERFGDMFARIPAALRRRMGVLGFQLDDAGCSATVDWGRAAVIWSDAPPNAPHYRLCAGHFVAVCRAPHGWSTLHVASRFSVHGWREGRAVQLFFPVSILYALGYFDYGLLAYLRPVALAAAWARRAELLDVLARLRRRAAAPAEGFERL